MSISVIEQIQSDLYNLVQMHDWSHMMSDSHQVWESGMKAEKQIQAKIHALIAVHREDAEGLYKYIKEIAGEDYSDYDSNGNGLKYRVINSWFKPYIDELK
jgi:hypothetical protein